MSDAGTIPSRGELAEIIRSLSRPMDPETTDVPPRLQSLPGIRAVLFDVYGTLFISGTGDLGVQQGAANRIGAMGEALAAVGLDPAAADRGVAHLIGKIRDARAKRRREGVAHPEVNISRIWEDVLSALAGEGRVPPAGAGVRVRLAVQYECRVNPVWPMPGAAEVLGFLHRRGTRLGIVSNAQFYTPLVLAAFWNRDLDQVGFERELCVWSYRLLEAKPSDWLCREALGALHEKHRIAPGETLVVGNDMLNDLAPAARTGCRTALFAGDRRSLRLRSDDPRAALEPDLVLTDLRQLLQAI